MKRHQIGTRIRSYFRERRQEFKINRLNYKKNSTHILDIFKTDSGKRIHHFFFDKIFHAGGKKYLEKVIYPEIKKDEKESKDIQKILLSDFLTSIEETEIGKHYRIASWGWKSEEDKKTLYQNFCTHIPIVSYEEYKPRIEKAKKESNIIWPGKTRRFSASSGTTSKKKHIPVTPEALASSRKAGLDMLAEYMHKYPESKILKGDFRPLVGSKQEELEDGSFVSDVSALLLIDRNSFSQQKYAFDLEILLNPNREEKRELFLQHINPHRPVTIMGVNSRAYELLEYIHQKDPGKYTTLTKNIELIIGGGVDVAPFMQYFKDVGSRYMWTYNASEGYFWYQDIINYDNNEGKAPYKLLTNHGIFYEFIPFDKNNFDENGYIKSTAKAKPLREINKTDIGKKYALVISTNAGLMRYSLGDVIEFVDDKQRFIIVWRTKQSLNLKGEELMETHVNTVLNILSKEEKIIIPYYTIGPDKEENPTCHEWIIEIQGNNTLNSKKEIYYTERIDELLQEINADYEAKRKWNILLKLPKIHFVPEWTFYNWLKYNKGIWGQIKVPKLSANRKIIEEIVWK